MSDVIIFIYISGFFFGIDKKENGNIIQHIYNTGLDHDDWSEAKDTFLVCKINGVHNPKIIRNSENHAEHLLIRHLRKKIQRKENAVKINCIY